VIWSLKHDKTSSGGAAQLSPGRKSGVRLNQDHAPEGATTTIRKFRRCGSGHTTALRMTKFGETMFTGIIEEIGHVTRIANEKGNHRLTVSSSQLVKELKQGDSIAVSGVCLTAVDIAPKSFTADLAEETWKRTSFSRIRKDALVNLELPMQANGRFGGHIVQGHVDGTGKFLALKKLPAGGYALQIEIPTDLARYVIFKGSLCIEGVSLTVAAIEGTEVTVAIIPHTVKMTNLKSLEPGDPINLEVDMIAKYVEKMLRGETASTAITVEKLVKKGF
jgi:riboflavin synthase